MTTHNSSILDWCRRFYEERVAGRTENTRIAQSGDLELFLAWWEMEIGEAGKLDDWTPTATHQYRSWLLARHHRPATINRYMATLRNLAKYLLTKHALEDDPFFGYRDLHIDYPRFKGLSKLEVLRLRAAAERLTQSKPRASQRPIRDAAVFYALLESGLRANELCQLALEQWTGSGFRDVKRKGSRVQALVPVGPRARAWIRRYLATERQRDTTDDNDTPLFLTHHGWPFDRHVVSLIVQRIAARANATSPDPIHASPHSLRHTFLSRVANKSGVHVAQRLSGNVGISQIFRYTQPSDEESAAIVDRLWEEEQP